MADAHPPIDIIRSPNRARTASARMVEGRLVVRVPLGITQEEEQQLIEKLVPRVLKSLKPGKKELPDLKARARELNRSYFGGKLKLSEIKWVSNQEKRYGSCTPAIATIRISDRVSHMPLWVLDYVIMHELSHLVEANHSPAFWKLVERYPLTERARGYLIAAQLEGDNGPENELDEA